MHARLRAAGALLLLTTGAAAQSTPELSRPERVFDELWTTFDRLYAPFAVRDMPWDALYALYRPRVSSRTTDEELFVVLLDDASEAVRKRILEEAARLDPAFPLTSRLAQRSAPADR